MKVNRKLYLPFIILVFIIAILGYYFKSNTGSSPKHEQSAETVGTQEIQSSKANPVELEEYYQIYKNPFVIHLRKAINGYLQGTNDGIGSPNVVVKAETDGEGLITGLDSFSKEYYRSKFVVVSFDNFEGGGKQITILFQDKPDKLFSAWVYEQAGITYDLRGFWQNNKVTGEKLQELNKQYKIFLEDKEHSL